MALKIGDYIHLKTFVMSFSALMLLLVVGLGLGMVLAPDTSHTPLSGKVMATIQLHPVQPPEPEPAIRADETDMPEPPPAHPVSHDQLTQDLEPKPLEAEDKNPSSETNPEPEDAQSVPLEIEDSVAGLSEESPLGYLPIIRKQDGLKPLDAYKAPFTLGPETKAVIALTMVDYGLSDRASKEALEKLPSPVTFIASPYAGNLQAKMTAARTKGNEVWLDIPVQSKNFAQNDTGPTSLLAGINGQQNIMRLNTNMGRATGYAGIAFSNTPDFPETSVEFQGVIDSIVARGLGITQTDIADTSLEKTTTQSKAPFIQNKIWIDASLNKNDILKSLTTLETLSLDNGYAVAAFHPSTIVLDAIATWQKSLKQKHIQLAPLTYALHQKSLIPTAASTPPQATQPPATEHHAEPTHH